VIEKLKSRGSMESINRVDGELTWSIQSKEPFEGFQANQPFKGSKPLKGLILTFFIFTQFAFAATIRKGANP